MRRAFAQSVGALTDGGVGSSRLEQAAAAAAAVAAGALLSMQSYLNGRLAGAISSAGGAAFSSATVGLFLLLAIALLRGTLVAGLRRLVRSPETRWWHFLAGILGGAMLAISTYAAPIVGVAVLAVAIVCGQTAGGLAVDAMGLSPMGRSMPTTSRLIGVAVAIAAVFVGSTSHGGHRPVVLLLVVALGGVGFSVQQAAVGHLRRISEDPFVGGSVVFLASAIVTLTMALATLPVRFEGLTNASWYDFLGGPLGVLVVIIMGTMVRLIGVLRMSLAMVAGQTFGGLGIDALAPTPLVSVNAKTIIGAALTLLAVVIASASWQRSRGVKHASV